MGQKVHPIAFRLGLNQRHQSEWFQSASNYSNLVFEDQKIRNALLKKYTKEAGISKIRITRNFQKNISLTIYAFSHEKFYDKGTKQLNSLRKFLKRLTRFQILNITLEPTKRTDARLIAMLIAQQIEKRKPFRRAIKMALASLVKDEVEGAKIQISGRLNGAEMARTEILRVGRVPLHTLRAKIDYCVHEAHTIYGILGIKVWVFKKK
jgi:small subunit ribosomal protein S3